MPTPDHLEVIDLHPGFASEVRGLDVNAPIDEETLTFLRRLFDDRGLLLIRQPDLDLRAQQELGTRLIGREPGPDVSERVGQPYFVSNREAGGGAPFGRLLFHSDGMWLAEPFQLLSLYAVELEAPVTPTSFVSTANAWTTVPPQLRERVEGLHVEHGHDATYERGEGDGDVLISTFESEESTVTPLVRRHPRTGRTLLYASQMMTKSVVELGPSESEELLAEVFEHLYGPDNTLEVHWEVGDLVLWDNIALQHARPNVVAEGPVRTLRKTFAPMPTATAGSSRPDQRTRATEVAR